MLEIGSSIPFWLDLYIQKKSYVILYGYEIKLTVALNH